MSQDGKRYICTLELYGVRGGKNVLWVSEDGTVVKQEAYHRYKERVARKEWRQLDRNMNSSEAVEDE